MPVKVTVNFDAGIVAGDEKSEVMSFSLATADGASIGFGECTIAKEQ